MLVVQPEPEFEGASAFELLQAIYRNRHVPLSVRIRCAIEALPFESPKLSATAVLTSEDFAERVKRAIARSEMAPKVSAVAVASMKNGNEFCSAL
jgi:hypothetical protein